MSCACGFRAKIYAAVSMYSLGCFSNSFRHSSEQKKYFFPANCAWNSGFFSSTSIPQTGSIVICVSVVQIRRACELSARSLPFAYFQVTERICFFSTNGRAPEREGKILPSGMHLVLATLHSSHCRQAGPSRSSLQMADFAADLNRTLSFCVPLPDACLLTALCERRRDFVIFFSGYSCMPVFAQSAAFLLPMERCIRHGGH